VQWLVGLTAVRLVYELVPQWAQLSGSLSDPSWDFLSVGLLGCRLVLPWAATLARLLGPLWASLLAPMSAVMKANQLVQSRVPSMGDL
jgi:hypothetical protein